MLTQKFKNGPELNGVIPLPAAAGGGFAMTARVMNEAGQLVLAGCEPDTSGAVRPTVTRWHKWLDRPTLARIEMRPAYQKNPTSILRDLFEYCQPFVPSPHLRLTSSRGTVAHTSIGTVLALRGESGLACRSSLIRTPKNTLLSRYTIQSTPGREEPPFELVKVHKLLTKSQMVAKLLPDGSVFGAVTDQKSVTALFRLTGPVLERHPIDVAAGASVSDVAASPDGRHAIVCFRRGPFRTASEMAMDAKSEDYWLAVYRCGFAAPLVEYRLTGRFVAFAEDGLTFATVVASRRKGGGWRNSALVTMDFDL